MPPFASLLLLLLPILFISSTPFAFCLENKMAANASTVAATNPNSLMGVSVADTQFVAAHNAVRQAVGVPPLVWDRRLATFARAYAAQRRGDCRLVHSPGYAYGENIFWGQGKRWAPADIVAAWAEEGKWYHYDTNTCSGPDCTHYTQIVWRTTEAVGCAKIVCSSGDTFAVCEYYPPGNYVGARPYGKHDP